MVNGPLFEHDPGAETADLANRARLPALQATERPILASLTSWDAVYYLGIACDGYQAGPANGPYSEVNSGDSVNFPRLGGASPASGS